MHRGYVKFYRRALDNGWLKDHPVWVLMSYCLLRANHAEAPDVCRGSKVSLKPGQFVFGRDSASRETALSPQQVRTALSKLQAYEFLTIRATKRFSVITICNWDIYQAEEKAKQPTEQPTGNQQVTNRQPTDNHKQECKNVNIKKEEIPPIVPQRVDYSDPDIDLLLISQEGWQEAWDGWKESRIAKGKKATKRAKELILKRLAERPDQAIEALNATVENGWSSFKWHYLEDKNTKEANNADIWNSPRLSQK